MNSRAPRRRCTASAYAIVLKTRSRTVGPAIIVRTKIRRDAGDWGRVSERHFRISRRGRCVSRAPVREVGAHSRLVQGRSLGRALKGLGGLLRPHYRDVSLATLRPSSTRPDPSRPPWRTAGRSRSTPRVFGLRPRDSTPGLATRSPCVSRITLVSDELVKRRDLPSSGTVTGHWGGLISTALLPPLRVQRTCA